MERNVNLGSFMQTWRGLCVTVEVCKLVEFGGGGSFYSKSVET